jgi:hypothetical protein
LRKCAEGEREVIRAPGAFGNPTVIPGFSPIPFNSSVPRVVTWWGLPLQCGEGVQATPVILTLVTCAPLPLAVFFDVSPAAVPPMFVAPAAAAVRPQTSAAANSAVASAVIRFAAPLLAGITMDPFVPSWTA